MKKKGLLFLLILTLTLAVAFAACEHKHIYSADWSTSASEHWHAAICEHTEEYADRAAHSIRVSADGKYYECEVCGYIGAAVTTPSVPAHEHTYAAVWSFDNEYHWLASTCEHSNEVKSKAVHTFEKGLCSVCGKFDLEQAAEELAVWSYSLNAADLEIAGELLDAEGSVRVKSGELNFCLNDDGEIVARGGLTVIQTREYVVNDVKVTDERQNDMILVVRDGIAYAYCEGDGLFPPVYARYPLEELLQESNVNIAQIEAILRGIEQSKDEIESYVSRILEFFNKTQPDLSALDDLFDEIFKETDSGTDGKKKYVVDYDALDKLNKTLATKSVSQYVDDAFYDGFYEDLPDTIESFLDMKVETFIAQMEKSGYTVDDVIAVMDKLIAEKYPDPEINSLDDFIRKTNLGQTGMTAKDLVRYVGKMNVGTLLETILEVSDYKATVDDLLDLIEEKLESYENVTVYGIIGSLNEKISSNSIEAIVGEFIDICRNSFTLELTLGADNRTEQIAAIFSRKESPSTGNLTDEQQAAQNLLADFKAFLASIDGEVKITKDFELVGDYDGAVAKINGILNAFKAPSDKDDAETFAGEMTALCNFKTQDVKITSGDKTVTVSYDFSQTVYFDETISLRLEGNATQKASFDSVVKAVKACKDSYAVTVPVECNMTIRKITVLRSLDEDSNPYDEPVVIEEAALSEYLKKNGNDMSVKEVIDYAKETIMPSKNLTLFYDLSIGEFIDPADAPHDWKENKDESVYSSVEQYDKIVYVCSKCGEKSVDYVPAADRSAADSEETLQ